MRGETAVDFTLNVAWIGPVWTVSLSSESDGIFAGRGDTFREALHAAFGTTPSGGEEAPAPKPALAIVGGTDLIARKA